MGVLQTIRGTVAKAAQRLGADNTQQVAESLARAVHRVQLEDTGWSQIGDGDLAGEFTAEERQANSVAARTYAVVNPLVKNGLAIRQAFIWGTGVGITAADSRVNELVQGFLDDPGNRTSFTGHQAHLDLERGLATDGNVFLVCFTDRRTGRVLVRTVPFTQVVRVVCNPEDASEPWFYLREWSEVGVDGVTATRRSAYYPALGYRPVTRVRRLGGVEVLWDAPMYHVRDGGNPGWQFGVPDLFAVTRWAQGYTGMLNDWARLTKALSVIAYRISGKTRTDTMAARQAMQAALAHGTPGGAIAATNAEIEAMPKTGANIDAESGLPLARMVAAGLGIPITMLIGDPGTTGARAVAETLTQPMVLGFKNRRELWTECNRAILNHVIDAAIEAPQGPLTGRPVTDNGQRSWELSAGERTLIIEFPEIEQDTLADTMSAISALDTSGLAPKETLARVGLRALKVRDVDELIDSMRDSDGEFTPANERLADALISQYQRGETT